MLSWNRWYFAMALYVLRKSMYSSVVTSFQAFLLWGSQVRRIMAAYLQKRNSNWFGDIKFVNISDLDIWIRPFSVANEKEGDGINQVLLLCNSRCKVLRC